MTTESTKPLIQIRGLTKSYSQTTALKNVDLDMVPGQIKDRTAAARRP